MVVFFIFPEFPSSSFAKLENKTKIALASHTNHSTRLYPECSPPSTSTAHCSSLQSSRRKDCSSKNYQLHPRAVVSSNPRGSGSTSNSGASNWILSGNQGNSQNKDNKSQTVVRVWWLIPIVLVQGKGRGSRKSRVSRSGLEVGGHPWLHEALSQNVQQ